LWDYFLFFYLSAEVVDLVTRSGAGSAKYLNGWIRTHADPVHRNFGILSQSCTTRPVVLDPAGRNTGSPATDPAPGPALACPGNRLR